MFLAFQNPIAIPGVGTGNFLRAAVKAVRGTESINALAFRKELAERIQNIAVSTEMQVDIAREVAKSMHNSLTLTSEATMGTNETAATIKELAARARQLKASVSRFKV